MTPGTPEHEAWKAEQQALQAKYAAARHEHSLIVQANSERAYGKGHSSKK